MIHYKPTPEQHPEYGGSACDGNVYRACFAAVEILTAQMRADLPPRN